MIMMMSSKLAQEIAEKVYDQVNTRYCTPIERAASVETLAALIDEGIKPVVDRKDKAIKQALTCFRRIYDDIEDGTVDVVTDIFDDERYFPLSQLRKALEASHD